MAKFVVDRPIVVLAGGTVSAACVKATLSLSAEDVDTTNFASLGHKERIGGLTDGSLALDFQQDLSSGAIDSVVFPLLGTVATFEVRPRGTATGEAKYSGSILISEYTPMDSAVGDLATFSVTWPVSGAVTRGTV